MQGKMEQQQCLSSALEPNRQVLEIYKNKLARAKGHN